MTVMLLSGLMALHAGAFAAWLAGAAADAALDAPSRAEARRVALRWTVPAMLLCLAAGAAAMALSYPFYREETWLWAKVLFTLPAAIVTLLRAVGALRAGPAFKTLTGLLTAALLLSFLRPF